MYVCKNGSEKNTAAVSTARKLLHTVAHLGYSISVILSCTRATKAALSASLRGRAEDTRNRLDTWIFRVEQSRETKEKRKNKEKTTSEQQATNYLACLVSHHKKKISRGPFRSWGPTAQTVPLLLYLM